jgi:hypothetical protein
MTPKRLVVLVEGDGDVMAAPLLVKRLLSEYGAFDAVILDPKGFRVGEYSTISKHEFGEWRRKLKAAVMTRRAAACLLLVDGDSPMQVDGQPFCAMRAAHHLAREAQEVGGGTLFSLAIVFACMEFESWLIAGAASLRGQKFLDGRIEIPETLQLPSCPDPETSPRDAKRWLRKIMTTGYKPTRDEHELTRFVDLDLVRGRGMRSFRRLEAAVRELVEAIRRDEHVVTPAQDA